MKRILGAFLLLTPGLLLAQPQIAELEARLADASGEVRVDLLSQLGEAHRGQGDLASALARFRGSLKLAREIEDKEAIAGNLLAIGQIHFREGRTPAAAETLRRARVAAGKSEAREHLPEILASIAEVYATLGRHREAYDALVQKGQETQESGGADADRQAGERIVELEAQIESERQQAEAESSKQRQAIARQEEAIARLESSGGRFGQLATAAVIAVPLLLLGLAFSVLSRRRFAKRSSEVIANRDLELEQASGRLRTTSAELERAGGELERKTFEHNRATSELVQTSAQLNRASTQLDEANAIREQATVSLAETAGKLQRTEASSRGLPSSSARC